MTTRKPPPKPRPVVARARIQRRLDELTAADDAAGVITAAAVIAQLPSWMRPYFRAWDR